MIYSYFFNLSRNASKDCVFLLGSELAGTVVKLVDET